MALDCGKLVFDFVADHQREVHVGCFLEFAFSDEQLGFVE
jgi:hypothetical protein